MSQPDITPDPMTLLAAAAVQMHELFRSYVEAGFTEEQAMELLIAVMNMNQGGAA